MVGILAAMIWSSIRAEPLAGKRFRWGTFVGWYEAFIAFAFPYMYYYRSPNLRLLSLVVGCCTGIASYGILHRRKYGVVMFAVASLLNVLFQMLSGGLLTSLVLPVFYSIVSLFYFGRRWSLLVFQPPKLKEIVLRGYSR